MSLDEYRESAWAFRELTRRPTPKVAPDPPRKEMAVQKLIRLVRKRILWGS